MKKHVLHTLGLAAMAALLCVFCGDNTTDGTAGGEVDALLSRFYNNETPGSGGGGDGTSLVLGNGQAWVYNDSGYIFTSDNRVFSVFKSDGGWWYRDTTGNYQTNGDIITINSVAGTYRISGETLLLSRYTYTFTKTSGVNPQTPYILNATANISSSAITVSRNPDQRYYRPGTVVTVKVSSTHTEHTFSNWSGASTATTPTVQITMDGNKTLTANFTVTVTPFTDSRDGRSYKRVLIGTQVWMAENLNYNAGGSVCYGGSTDNCAKYGRLYNWSTAMNGSSNSSANPSGVQGVCPPNYHLPSDAEWMTLMNYVGSNAGTKLKSSTGWNSSNGTPVGTDEYGFSALPGGWGNSEYGGAGAGGCGYWWSATESDAGSAGFWAMYYNGEFVNKLSYNKTNLLSVRCAQD